MSYDLDRLNNLITSPEIHTMAKSIMKEYHDAIDQLMVDNMDADVKEVLHTTNPENVSDLEGLATKITKRRMAKYGSQFFETEIARLLDSYNDELYDTLEFNIRCEILSGLAESLTNFKFSHS